MAFESLAEFADHPGASGLIYDVKTGFDDKS